MGPCLNIWFLSTKFCCKSRQELKHYQGYLTYRWGWWDANVSSRKTKGKRESRKATHSLCYIFFAQIIMSQRMSLCEAQNSGWGGSLLPVFSVSQDSSTRSFYSRPSTRWLERAARLRRRRAKPKTSLLIFHAPCPQSAFHARRITKKRKETTILQQLSKDIHIIYKWYFNNYMQSVLALLYRHHYPLTKGDAF